MLTAGNAFLSLADDPTKQSTSPPYADLMERSRVGPVVPLPATGRRLRLRRAVNWVNTSTLLGLGLARVTRGSVTPGPHGLYLVRDSGLKRLFPHNSATT